MTTRSADEVVYLYGFVRAGAPRPPAELTGLEGRGIGAMSFEGFEAVYSLLPVHIYGADALPDHLKDLGWVGPRGLLHEQVVTWYVDHGGILPVPFLTLYSSADALLGEVRERSSEIREQLDRLAGLREWNLKVAYDPERLDAALGTRSPEIEELDRRIAESSPGRGYLLERKRDQLAARIMEGVATDMARELLRQMRGSVEATRVIPVPPGLEGVRVVLNAAVLVRVEREADARARIEEEGPRLEAKGLEVTFSGPWAPYRFVGDTGDGT